MYLFDNPELKFSDILTLAERNTPDKLVTDKNLINSINSNSDNFYAFLHLFKQHPISLDDISLRRIYKTVCKHPLFKEYIDCLYQANIIPYIKDKHGNDFISSFFYDDEKEFCNYLHTKGHPKIMSGMDAASNYAIINNDFKKFENIIRQNYAIDTVYTGISLSICKFPKDEETIKEYIDVFKYWLSVASPKALELSKDKIYTKICLFKHSNVEMLNNLHKDLPHTNFNVNFHIYEDKLDGQTMSYLYNNKELLEYLYSKHCHEEHFKEYKNQLFLGFIKSKDNSYKDMIILSDLFDVKIDEDEAFFLFHDYLKHPELIKFIIQHNHNFDIDYSILKREVIKNLTVSPEHSENFYSYHSSYSSLKTLYEICSKHDFNPNFKYTIDYFEKDREKKNPVNLLEIFINNDQDGYMIDKLKNLSGFNFQENLFFTLSKYQKVGKLIQYCEINYNNIFKMGLNIDKEELISSLSTCKEELQLEIQLKSLFEKSDIVKNLDLSFNKEKYNKVKRL